MEILLEWNNKEYRVLKLAVPFSFPGSPKLANATPGTIECTITLPEEENALNDILEFAHDQRNKAKTSGSGSITVYPTEKGKKDWTHRFEMNSAYFTYIQHGYVKDIAEPGLHVSLWIVATRLTISKLEFVDKPQLAAVEKAK